MKPIPLTGEASVVVSFSPVFSFFFLTHEFLVFLLLPRPRKEMKTLWNCLFSCVSGFFFLFSLLLFEVHNRRMMKFLVRESRFSLTENHVSCVVLMRQKGLFTWRFPFFFPSWYVFRDLFTLPPNILVNTVSWGLAAWLGCIASCVRLLRVKKAFGAIPPP